MTQSYCAEQVRLYDYERYVTTLFSPQEQRQSLWALYAFHHEIARIKYMVTEPMMGLIRLQWWRNAISKMYAGQALRHEVIQEIFLLIQGSAPWSEQDFHDLLDGYEVDLQTNDFVDDQECLAHMERLSEPLLKMACQVSGTLANKETIKIIGRSYEAMRCFNPISDSLKIKIKNDLSAINRKIVNKTPPLLMYYCTQYRLKHPEPRMGLLSFYIWYKRFFC